MLNRDFHRWDLPASALIAPECIDPPAEREAFNRAKRELAANPDHPLHGDILQRFYGNRADEQLLDEVLHALIFQHETLPAHCGLSDLTDRLAARYFYHMEQCVC